MFPFSDNASVTLHYGGSKQPLHCQSGEIVGIESHPSYARQSGEIFGILKQMKQMKESFDETEGRCRELAC